MEAVPRMPMIWLDLKEAGEFAFNAAVKKVRPGRGRRGSGGAADGRVGAPLGWRPGCLRGPWGRGELELGGLDQGRG